GAEHRDRGAARDDIRLRRHLHLASVRRYGEEMVKGPTIQLVKRPILVTISGTDFGHRAYPADGRDAVADGATGPVKRRSQAVRRALYFGEILLTDSEQLVLGRRDADERTSRNGCVGRRKRRNGRCEESADNNEANHFTISCPRIKW